MNKITNITLIIALLFIIPLTARSADPELPEDAAKLIPLIPGTDTPHVKKCGNGTVYRYKEYTIYTIPTKQLAGENINVYHTDKKDGRLCKTPAREPLYTYDNDVLGGANFFAGLYVDYLFIDQGTGPTYRGLSIYDLKSGKLQYFTNYTDPVLSDGTLTYFETVHPREFYNAGNQCILLGDWAMQGLRTHYQRQTAYNLETGKKEALDKYRCRPGQ